MGCRGSRENTKNGQFFVVYSLGKKLGQGSFGQVREATKRATDEVNVAKIIDIRLSPDDDDTTIDTGKVSEVRNECKLWRQLGNTNACVVKLFETFQDQGVFYMVMEKCRCSLLDNLEEMLQMSHADIIRIFREMLQGIKHLHSCNVAHRDVKLDNFLVGDDGIVKIADFGLSKLTGSGGSAPKTRVGTPQYWAPEVQNVEKRGGSYGAAADLWSVGVMLYVMLCGKYPFDDKVRAEKRLVDAAFEGDGARWQDVSEDAKDIVRGLLRVDPKERLGVEECLRHPWLQPPGDASAQRPSTPEGAIVAVSPAPAAVEDASEPRRYSMASPQVLEPPDGEASAAAAQTDADQACRDARGCFEELLVLQVSIGDSLETARYAVSAADPGLADSIGQTASRAHKLFQQSRSVITRYAQTAQHVRGAVLPDLLLAVQEREPRLADSLFGMVQAWVAELSGEGDAVRRAYCELQDSVLALTSGARQVKRDSDQWLGQAVQQALQAAPQPIAARSCSNGDAVCLGNGTDHEVDDQLAVRHVRSDPQPWNTRAEQLFRQLLAAQRSRADPDEWTHQMLDLLFMAPPRWPQRPPDGAADAGLRDSLATLGEEAARSSLALLRALWELRQVEDILVSCAAFWDDIGATAQRLAQMRDHTERLIRFAGGSAAMRERFEQRLAEYADFWASLESLCAKYCLDHSRVADARAARSPGRPAPARAPRDGSANTPPLQELPASEASVGQEHGPLAVK
mmetsp:Transcript_65178/g.191230  ORF Transcript_65178/g.191230 Transcript_65178/m.191230 type:complete len:741 (-) Transcript_65178:83-2305(-)